MKIRIISFAACLLLLCVSALKVFPQNDLKNMEDRLGKLEGKEKLELLNEIAKSYLDIAPDQAQKYAIQALDLARYLKDKKAEGASLQYIGNSWVNMNDKKKALEMFQASLELRLKIEDTIGTAKTYNSMGMIYSDWSIYEKALLNYSQAQKYYELAKDYKGTAKVLNNIGKVYLRTSEYKKALESFQKSMAIFEKIEMNDGITSCLNGIASVHENMNNYTLAQEYYDKAIKIAKSSGNIMEEANILDNLGNLSSKRMKDYVKAVEFYKKSLAKRKEIDYKPGIASSLNNIGTNYLFLKKYDQALGYYQQAYKINQELNDQYGMTVNLLGLGKCYYNLNDKEKALYYLNLCRELAYNNKLKSELMQGYESFSEVYEKVSDFKNALRYYKLFKEVNDSIYSESSQKAITEMQTKYETEKKEQQIKIQKAENDKKDVENKKQRIIIYAVFGVLALVVVMIIQTFVSLQRKKRDNKIIAAEKAKSEALLLNTLPEKVVNDLKEHGKTEPESFDSVSVYFSDICGFTEQSSRLDPQTLIGELNDIFTAFDDIMIRNKCERIKTIGDAYMAVCGMPERKDDHAYNIMKAAFEIKDYLNKRNEENELKWRIRIGINSGPVVGAIVGVRKYLYDVFGDTVNTASRMETNSEPMRINTTEATYTILKDKFEFIEREPISVKGKGMMKMFFVERPIVPFS